MKLGQMTRVAGSLLIALLLSSPSPGQIRSVDPATDFSNADTAPLPADVPVDGSSTVDPAPLPANGGPASPSGEIGGSIPSETGNFAKEDLIAEAEGVFGKGTKGIGGLIEKILNDQGQPNAYIKGREASAALVVGLRYGSGMMNHKIEGARAVYWTGPSVGFDAGGDATKVFVLVYNLYDGQDLYRRYPQVEGRAYYFGGLSGTYLRRGNIVMIPIRLGVGMRLGANIGYMKFSEKAKWIPL
jgi:hypothetical protein